MNEHVLERAGCPIHYWLSGAAPSPLVVFSHGAGANHRMFDPQIQALERSYRLLAWDVRGHGRSRPIGDAFSIRQAVADLIAILDRIGAKQAVFVGQSMGANIAQELVFSHPERALALVIIGSTCTTLELSFTERLALLVARPLLRLYPWETLKAQSSRASSIRPEVRTYLLKTMSVIGRDDFIRTLFATMDCLHEEPGYRTGKPLLLMHGEHDGTGNIRKVAPRWAAREPCCRYVVVPDAGHCANQDNPGFVNALLKEFLGEQPRGGVSS